MENKIQLVQADIYKVYNKGIITNEKINIIYNLYQPIIGNVAVSLYLTLLNDLKMNNNSFTHYHLMTSMQLKLESIRDARSKLEGIGLMKTYIKQGSIDEYLYVLFSPLSAYEFFNHPILNIVLYNNIGAKEYEIMQNYYKVPRLSTKDYIDITESFENVYTASTNTSLLFDNNDINF